MATKHHDGNRVEIEGFDPLSYRGIKTESFWPKWRQSHLGVFWKRAWSSGRPVEAFSRASVSALRWRYNVTADMYAKASLGTGAHYKAVFTGWYDGVSVLLGGGFRSPDHNGWIYQQFIRKQLSLKGLMTKVTSRVLDGDQRYEYALGFAEVLNIEIETAKSDLAKFDVDGKKFSKIAAGLAEKKLRFLSKEQKAVKNLQELEGYKQQVVDYMQQVVERGSSWTIEEHAAAAFVILGPEHERLRSRLGQELRNPMTAARYQQYLNILKEMSVTEADALPAPQLLLESPQAVAARQGDSAPALEQ